MRHRGKRWSALLTDTPVSNALELRAHKMQSLWRSATNRRAIGPQPHHLPHILPHFSPGPIKLKHHRVTSGGTASALALRAGLAISRRVRATDRGVRFGRFSKRNDGVFWHKENNKKTSLKDCWGKGLKCRPLPQTPSPARRCKNPSMKAETVSK